MGQTFKSQTFKSQAVRFETYSTAADPIRMADMVMQFAPATDAEALKLLRFSFPDSPLSMRVAALDFLMRRHSRSPAGRLQPQISLPYAIVEQ
jgi:hypothetical protein